MFFSLFVSQGKLRARFSCEINFIWGISLLHHFLQHILVVCVQKKQSSTLANEKRLKVKVQ